MGVCLVLTVVSWVVLRSLDAPWSGRTGKLIFGEARGKLGIFDHYAGVLRCFFDSAAKCREKFRAEDWITVGCWVGTLGFMLAGVVATLSAPVWVRWCRHPDCPPELVPSGWKASRVSIVILVGALALASAIRLPTLGGGLLWDEQDNHRRNFHGYHEVTAPDAAPKWVEATWKHALWENRRGNNPMFYSGCAWASNALWRAVTGAPREQFSVVATRLPAALCGILSIATLWWLLNVVGLPRVAPVAALLSAVHPLCAEFSMEARAYGMTLFFVPLMLGAGWRMLKACRARDSVMFGISQVIILLGFPGGFYGIAAVNLAMAGLLVWQWRQRLPTATARLGRWTLTNTVSGVLLFCLLAPNIPQMVSFMNNSFQDGVMPPFWYVVSYNLFATGMHFQFPRETFFAPEGPWPSAWAWLFGDYWRAWPVALWALVVVPVLGVAGVVRWIRSADRTFTVLALALLAGGGLCVAHHALITGYYIYAWYAIYILPVLLAALATGALWLVRADTDEKQRASAWRAAGVVVLMVCWMLGISHPMVRRTGWVTESVAIHPRPVKPNYHPEPGMIGCSTFVRGQSLWVVYEDGYHALLTGAVDHEDEWQAYLKRPRARFGSFP